MSSSSQPFTGCMTAWIGNEPRIKGTIKVFWEDFHVREISLDGSNCALTELITPLDVRNAQVREMAKESGEDWWVLSEEDFQQKLDDVLKDKMSELSETNRRSLEHFLRLIHELYKISRSFQAENDSVQLEEPSVRDQKPDCHTEESAVIEHTHTDNHDAILRTGRLSRIVRKMHVNLAVEDDSKTSRTQFHKLIAENLNFVETKTVEYAEIQSTQNSDDAEAIFVPLQLQQRLNRGILDDKTILSDGKYIQIELKAPCIAAIDGRNLSTFAIQQHQQRKRQKNCSDETDGIATDYLSFSVLKMNRDSSEASSKIAKSLRRKANCISFAGTKDRRGVTVQKMSAFRVTKSDLKAAVASLDWDRSVWISDLHYSTKRLKLGDLIGNNFTVVIRDVPMDEMVNLREACDSFRVRGFVNYFGLQRFGTKNIRTHEIGAALIGQKYREAVRLILGDDQLVKQFRKRPNNEEGLDVGCNDASFDESTATHWYLYKDNAQKALSLLSRRQYVESIILKFLTKEPKGFVPALQQLPRNCLGLYFHAAQSIIWNFVVSERIKRFGSLRPVIGDLVIPSIDNNPSSDDTLESDELEADQLEDDQEVSEDQQQQHQHSAIRPVTLDSEDLCGQYTIKDVVLPLPGDDVMYPTNMLEVYKAASQELIGVPLEALKTDDGHRLCEIHGSYRHMIGAVNDVSYEILEHGQYVPNKPILASDVDRLTGKAIETTAEGFKVRSEVVNKTDSSGGIQTNTIDGEAKEPSAVVILSCSLKKSSYLTVALRELLCDTSLVSSQQEGSGFKRQHHDGTTTHSLGNGRSKRPPFDRSNRDRSNRDRSDPDRHRPDSHRGGGRYQKRPKNYQSSTSNSGGNPLVTS